MTYGYQTHPPKPPMSTGKKVALFGCLPATLLGILLFGGCAALVGGAANEVDKSVKADAAEDKRAAKEDVKLLGCTVTDSVIGKDVESKVTITNNGKKRANYLVTGEFLAADGSKVGELLASVDNLAPGTSSTQKFAGLFTSDQLAGVGKGTCKILDVSRDTWSAAN